MQKKKKPCEPSKSKCRCTANKRWETKPIMQKTSKRDWLIRFVKGIFIGSGFILTGVSGGALAAVFGLYEKLISFLAHITRNFVANFLYFLPVGLGGIAGVFVFSFAISFFLGAYEVQMLWLFVGAL